MSVDIAAYLSRVRVLDLPRAAALFWCGSGLVHCSACHDLRLVAQCAVSDTSDKFPPAPAPAR
eukprot:13773307-Heterocapsa_arctica.AAC.1